MPVDAADLFRSQLPLIEGVIRVVSGRHRLSASDAEEFASHARLALIDHDYQILRQFRERSSLRTYLCTVVERLLLDYRIRQWGKWRPSAQARRAGPVAVRLEALLHKDGLPFEHAAGILTSEGAVATRAEVDALRARLPHRLKRRTVGEEAIAEIPVGGEVAESAVMAREAAAMAARTRAVLAKALSALPPEDRLIVRLHYGEGLTIADVARALRLDAKRLYRQVDRLLGLLRESLEAEGISGLMVAGWLDHEAWDEEEAGNAVVGPSL